MEFAQPIKTTEKAEEFSPREDKEVITSKREAEIPFSHYRDINKSSYTEKFFQSDLKQEANTIDDYIISQIQERGLTDSQESYEYLIEEILDCLNLEPTQLPNIKVERIIKFINILNKTSQKGKIDSLLKRI